MKEFEKDILKKYTPCRKGDELSKVARAIAIVHGELEMIHPFREGNGRLGRLIAALMALQAGYPPPIFNIKEKIYYNAMKEVFANKNYDPLTKIIERVMELGVKKARG